MGTNWIDFLKLEPSKNSYYFINNDMIISGYANLCVNESYEIEKYSNDWLYLIKGDPDLNAIKSYIIENGANHEYIDEDVIPLITAFNTSVHCFCGCFSILYNYFNNLNYYSNLKFIIYKNLQKGVLDLILFFCDSLDIPKENLIFLDHNKIYKFRSVTIIPNTLHSYVENIETRDNICKFIEKNILSKQEILNLDKYKITENIKNIAIFKTCNNYMTTPTGAITEEHAIDISEQYNCKLVDIGIYNEIQIIQLIQNCENIVFSWGTNFIKNFIYISESCKNITVIIIGGDYTHHYNHFVKYNMLINKFKNANIYYKFI